MRHLLFSVPTAGIRQRRRVIITGFALAAVVSVAPAARAVNYTGAVLNQLVLPNGAMEETAANSPKPAAGGQVVSSSMVGTDGYFHAFLWAASSSQAIDLNPAGCYQSVVFSTDGTQQVGLGQYTDSLSNFRQDALLWSGSAGSVIDLNAPGVYSAVAMGIGGGQQVGNSMNDAVVWSGSAASMVVITPTDLPEIVHSYPLATDGVYQVGYGTTSRANGPFHALLWSGTASSAVDLNPADMTATHAFGVGGNQQVGEGYGPVTGDQYHALLWTGSADSVVDLNANGLNYSIAYGTDGAQQVGYGFGDLTGGQNHALLWSGSANSVMDLQSLLPANGYWNDSYAYSIDANGNIYGISEGLYDGVSGEYAVEWSPVPEPTVFSLLIVASTGLLRRRRFWAE